MNHDIFKEENMITPYYHKESSILICENTFSFLEKMKDNSIDMIFADPPYFLSNDGILVDMLYQLIKVIGIKSTL